MNRFQTLLSNPPAPLQPGGGDARGGGGPRCVRRQRRRTTVPAPGAGLPLRLRTALRPVGQGFTSILSLTATLRTLEVLSEITHDVSGTIQL
jgi:hypothetical protein